MRVTSAFAALVCLGLGLAACGPSFGSDLIAIQPLTDGVIMLHFKDGHVEHHKRGESRSQEKVVVRPLDVEAASKPAAYAVTSPRRSRLPQFEDASSRGPEEQGNRVRVVCGSVGQ